jgi:hypothetical protein
MSLFGYASLVGSPLRSPIGRLFDNCIETKNKAIMHKVWRLLPDDQSDFNALFEGNKLRYTPRKEVLDLLAEVKLKHLL